jgi:Reverse transcriptase (RNA-dependent DNA polymerase)
MLEVHNTTIDLNKHVLPFTKAIYGLVQAVRQQWKKVKEVMAGCNYYLSKSDPCLFIKRAENDESLSFVIMYVDDGGIIGTPDAIKDVISALGKSFKDKTMGDMENFVGCKIIDTIEKDGVWKHQPKLLKNFKESFKSIIGDSARIFKTPSAPKTLIIRSKEGDLLISPEKQKTFRMRVGMLLYLIKHSRPNISTVIEGRRWSNRRTL